jgi:hypothetical protein
MLVAPPGNFDSPFEETQTLGQRSLDVYSFIHSTNTYRAPVVLQVPILGTMSTKYLQAPEVGQTGSSGTVFFPKSIY